jgi:hypothetical protein
MHSARAGEAPTPVEADLLVALERCTARHESKNQNRSTSVRKRTKMLKTDRIGNENVSWGTYRRICRWNRDNHRRWSQRESITQLPTNRPIKIAGLLRRRRIFRGKTWRPRENLQLEGSSNQEREQIVRVPRSQRRSLRGEADAVVVPALHTAAEATEGDLLRL